MNTKTIAEEIQQRIDLLKRSDVKWVNQDPFIPGESCALYDAAPSIALIQDNGKNIIDLPVEDKFVLGVSEKTEAYLSNYSYNNLGKTVSFDRWNDNQNNKQVVIKELIKARDLAIREEQPYFKSDIGTIS